MDEVIDEGKHDNQLGLKDLSDIVSLLSAPGLVMLPWFDDVPIVNLTLFLKKWIRMLTCSSISLSHTKRHLQNSRTSVLNPGRMMVIKMKHLWGLFSAM